MSIKRKQCPHYCNGYCFWNGDTGEVCDTGNNQHDGYCPMAENDRELEEIAAAMMAEDGYKPTPPPMPTIKVGDLIEVKSCHSAEPHIYEVSSKERGCLISQPAHFSHNYNEVAAVFRRTKGGNFKRIWKRPEEDK